MHYPCAIRQGGVPAAAKADCCNGSDSAANTFASEGEALLAINRRFALGAVTISSWSRTHETFYTHMKLDFPSNLSLNPLRISHRTSAVGHRCFRPWVG